MVSREMSAKVFQVRFKTVARAGVMIGRYAWSALTDVLTNNVIKDVGSIDVIVQLYTDSVEAASIK